jgi:hypothetical protein
MAKVRRRIRKTGRARVPAWIRDKARQSKWNNEFIAILKRDYQGSDATISAILSDELLSQRCATRIRSYVDKGVTLRLNLERKARGAKTTQQLKTAIAGFDAAIDLHANTPRQELVPALRAVRENLSQALGRCKKAFATKRHGRDRDHAILYECYSFLQAELEQPVTYVTLANLVNAGFDAGGSPSTELIDEEKVRKNLANFKRNNPLWSNELAPRLKPLLVEPETK